MKKYKLFTLLFTTVLSTVYGYGQFAGKNLEAGYYFTKNLSLNIRIRHYWSTVKYLEFYMLDEDGHLNESDYTGDHNISFNSFNIDMGLIWRFAPGSELSLVWKNSILDQDAVIPDTYLSDLKNLFDKPQMNSISFKAIYYLDYQTLKNWH